MFDKVRPMRKTDYDDSDKTAYEMFLCGMSYEDIADKLQRDLFDVMGEISQHAALHSKFRSKNRHSDFEFLVANLRQVINVGWKEHGEVLNEEKGIAKDNLQLINNAVKTLASVLMNSEKFELINEEVKKELRGIKPETLRALGKAQVHNLWMNNVEEKEKA